MRLRALSQTNFPAPELQTGEAAASKEAAPCMGLDAVLIDRLAENWSPRRWRVSGRSMLVAP